MAPAFIHHLPLPSHRRPGARSSPLAVIPAVYLAAARLVREPHWDHHGRSLTFVISAQPSKQASFLKSYRVLTRHLATIMSLSLGTDKFLSCGTDPLIVIIFRPTLS
jgi:hypothetical protein